MSDTSDTTEIEDAERDGRQYRRLITARYFLTAETKVLAGRDLQDIQTVLRDLTSTVAVLVAEWSCKGGPAYDAFRRAAGLEGDE